LLVAGVLVVSQFEYAFAYIDPATGSYVFQWLIAGLIAAGLAIRIGWRSVRAFLGRVFSRRRPADPKQP